MRCAWLIVPILLLTRAGNLPAQAGEDRWQITLENGQYVWDIRLVRLGGDSLYFRQADTVGMVSVQQMTELRLIRKTEMRVGAAAEGGGAMAALVGADDEVYDFKTLDFPARLHTIQQVLLVHPPKS